MQTYPVTVQFTESGHLGSGRVFGDTLFILGKQRGDGSPVAWKGSLISGASETSVFPGDGKITGVFQRNGTFVSTGYLDTTSGRQITYWDGASAHSSNSSGTNFDVSVSGRVVGSRGSIDAYFCDVGAEDAVVLPGIVGTYLGAYSTTGDGRFTGGGASNENLDTVGIVYEQQVDGPYDLIDVQYLPPEN